MSHYHDNVRPLVQRQVSSPHRYPCLAKVIPLHPRLHEPRPGRAVGLFLFTIAASVLIAALLLFVFRTAESVLDHVFLGRPWA
jgi:hypothetical protein